MVNAHCQLEDDDLEGSNIGDSPSESKLEPAQRSRDKVLWRAGLLSTSDKEGDDEGDEENPGEDEQGSPARVSSHPIIPQDG